MFRLLWFVSVQSLWKMCPTVLVFVAILGLANAGGFGNVMQGVRDFIRALDTEGAGKFDRDSRCSISWSFQGLLMGLEWRYMSICKDSCTGETATAFSDGKPESVEKCLLDLYQKLQRDEL